jgi:hypothetical protein
MAKGVIYVMETVVTGLVKIGKTETPRFKERMRHLESNGYRNVTGLKRRFAIEVEDYDEKEALLDDIFSKARVVGTELFALDIDLVIQLLSSLEGRQVFPEEESKEEAFEHATEERRVTRANSEIPDGTYYLTRKVKGFGEASGELEAVGGALTLRAGARCAPVRDGQRVPAARRDAAIEGGVLREDVECGSPSTAAAVVTGGSEDGWRVWKTADGRVLDDFRKKDR